MLQKKRTFERYARATISTFLSQFIIFESMIIVRWYPYSFKRRLRTHFECKCCVFWFSISPEVGYSGSRESRRQPNVEQHSCSQYRLNSHLICQQSEGYEEDCASLTVSKYILRLGRL
jgi:hypothetical protein